ncbi:hypothetical protein KY363_07680 [Candidatus Woesearchaeota archaeon]|nr:hypothetical protein [Candidatus Woesearchaeota archaeon]
MQLYPLLKDRASINILKILYDNESSAKKYTMGYSELKAKLAVSEGLSTLDNLRAAELITSEGNGNGELVLSITQKGKDFIDAFDKLLAVMSGQKKEQHAYKVEYDLTVLEQRILVICSKIKSETGAAVALANLTQEVYPYKDPVRTSGTISKYAKKLEELNLLLRIRKNNRTFFDTTESGERVVQEKLQEAPEPVL